MFSIICRQCRLPKIWPPHCDPKKSYRNCPLTHHLWNPMTSHHHHHNPPQPPWKVNKTKKSSTITCRRAVAQFSRDFKYADECIIHCWWLSESRFQIWWWLYYPVNIPEMVEILETASIADGFSCWDLLDSSSDSRHYHCDGRDVSYWGVGMMMVISWW